MNDNPLSLFDDDVFAWYFLCNGFEEKVPLFVRLFRAVWAQLPVTDRDSISRLLGAHQIPFLVWLQGKEAYPQKQGPARYDNLKNMMMFDADRLFRLPVEGWLALVIAHELGHVFLFAVDDPTHTAPEPKERRAMLEWDGRREEAVKQLLGQWQFDLAEHDRLEKWGKGSDWGRSADWLKESSPVEDHEGPGAIGNAPPG